jgi:hypothetical protein
VIEITSQNYLLIKKKYEKSMARKHWLVKTLPLREKNTVFIVNVSKRINHEATTAIMKKIE